MSERPQDDDATRGLTLRELVLEVRYDTKVIGTTLSDHLRAHAEEDGQTRGESKVFGIARSGLAVSISILSATIAVLAAFHFI